MKISKKQLAKWQKQEQNRSAGRVASNEEMEKAWMKLEAKLKKPEMMAVFQRMKNR